MKIILVLVASILLVGCTSEGYDEADGKVLCDPETHKAYLIEHRALDVSFVEPFERGNELCKID